MIRVLPFHHEHLKLVVPTEVFLGETNFDGPGRFQHAHTLMDGDTLIGCIGGTVLWPGVFEVWAYFSKGIYKNPLGFCKVAKKTLEIYENTLSLHRVQTYVRVGFPMAKKWAEHLGFQTEGIVKKFGLDASDYYIMGKVKDV